MGFSFLPEEGSRKSTHVRIESGVNRNFSDRAWDRIKEYTAVKTLLSLGALVVTQEVVDVTATAVVEASTEETLESVDLKNALSLIEASFDLDQLNKWSAKDQRIRVKNGCAKRIQAITEGNG